ncbi:MAG: thioredoxin domain-containing protein [Acidimicrobiales bacterium]
MTDEAASRIKEADRDGLRAALGSERRVLVEFWAPWCVQCGPMARVVERFVADVADDVAVLKVSLEDEAIADEYDLMSLPAICFFVDGQPAKLVTGFKGAAALREEFATLVA